MRSILVLSMVMVCVMTGTTMYGQQADQKVITADTLEFPGELRSRKIPLAIGEFFEMPANCARKPTTFIRATRFVFPEASLGRIDTCSLAYELQADTVRKTIITLPNALSVQQAGKQAAKQFGKPVYTKVGSEFVYTWTYTTRENRRLNIRLEVSANLQSGMLLAEEQM